jgi:hypothetical protein
VRWAPLIVAVLAMAFAAPARSMELAIQDEAAIHKGWVAPGPGYWLDIGRQLGATWLRLNAHLPDAMSDRRLAESIGGARQRGYRVELTLTWGDYHIKDFNPRQFAQLAGQAASRFRSARRFSILNEPELTLVVPHRADVYRRTFRLAYRAIHRVRPHAHVLLGETSPHAQPRFIRRLLCLTRGTRMRCRHLHADGYAHHPYQGGSRPDTKAADQPGGIGDTPQLLRQLRRSPIKTRRGRRLPLYFTEFGYHSHETVQAAYWWPLALRYAERLGVRQILAYQLVHPAWAKEGSWDTALEDGEGIPRPAFYAIRSRR